MSSSEKVAAAKVKLFELLKDRLPNVTDRESRVLMHLCRDEAVNPSVSSRKK